MIVFFLCLAASVKGAERYRWPLDTERRLSSSFGEFREGHYHAGLDLRTFGQIGLPCHAADRSELARLRVASKGYGRAVYLRLADGTMAVYGHLNGFNRTLDSLAYEWRIAHRTNWCDITFPSGGPRFETGQVVAYTGRSGSPHPHLHYELRDAAGRPYNPLVSVYEVPDAGAPVLGGLEVVPMTWGSLVNASPVPVTCRFHAAGKNRFTIRDTLMLDGTFGFGVSVWDRQDHGGYRLGPYDVSLSIDGVPAYRVTNQRFDYADIGDVVLEYDEVWTPPPGHYLLLFRKPGNVMENREGVGVVGSAARRDSARVLGLADGPHEALIVARDARGNESTGRFTFVIHASPVAEIVGHDPRAQTISIRAGDPDGGRVRASLAVSRDGGKSWRGAEIEPAGDRFAARIGSDSTELYRLTAIDDEGAEVERYFAFPESREGQDTVPCDIGLDPVSDGIVARIAPARILASAPSVLVGASGADSLRVFQAGPRQHFAFIPAERLVDGVNVLKVRGRDYRGFPIERAQAFYALVLGMNRARVFHASDSVVVSLRSQSNLGPTTVLVRGAPGQRKINAGLEPLAPAFRVDFPLDRITHPILVGLSGGRGAGLFQWQGKAGWRCLGVPTREGETVDLRRPGVYAVFRDVRPPVLKGVVHSQRGGGSGFFKRRLCAIPVRDGGSGVDPEAVVVTIDGEPAIGEWDEYRGRLEIPIPASHRRGPARLNVSVSDRAGNETTGQYTIMIE